MNKQMNIFVDQIPNNKNFYDTKKRKKENGSSP